MTDLANSPQALPALKDTAAALAAASLSPGTRSVYASVLAGLDRHLAGSPLNDGSLAEYLAVLFEAGKSPAAAGLVVAAAKLRARLLGLASPAGPATERVLAGFRREARNRGRGQATGIRWEQADAAAALAASGGDLAGLRDAAILAVASDALLRVSETSALEVADLAIEADGSGRLTIRRSKTDQEGSGAVQYVGPSTVRRVRAWLNEADILAGPLFRRIRRGGVVVPVPLSPQSIRAIVRERARAAGIEGRVSGHSLRVGAAQSLAAAGASVVEMQIAGRWSSPTMPGLYARGQLAGRGAVARLRYGGQIFGEGSHPEEGAVNDRSENSPGPVT